jgi:hypothetical protein
VTAPTKKVIPQRPTPQKVVTPSVIKTDNPKPYPNKKDPIWATIILGGLITTVIVCSMNNGRSRTNRRPTE